MFSLKMRLGSKFLASQGRHEKPTKAKFGLDKYTIGLLSYAKFNPDCERRWVREPPKFQTWSYLGYYRPRWNVAGRLHVSGFTLVCQIWPWLVQSVYSSSPVLKFGKIHGILVVFGLNLAWKSTSWLHYRMPSVITSFLYFQRIDCDTLECIDWMRGILCACGGVTKV